MPEITWTECFTVRVFETGANGTLAVRSLCDFLQEAAGNHARALGVSVEELLRKDLTWVLSRLRMQVHRLPLNGEPVTVRTWPSGIDRLFAFRDFTVSDAQGKTISSAVSAWLILDTRSRRPVRVQGIFDLPDTSSLPRAFAADLEKLPGCADAENEISLSVRWSDLDVNRHVNNSRYAEWVVEGVAGGERESGVLTRLDIDFLAETQHPGTVLVRARHDASQPSRMVHAIARAEDGVEVARARTEWKAGPREEKRKPIAITVLRMANLFPSLMQQYLTHPAGAVAVTNTLAEPLEKVRARFLIPRFMDLPVESRPVARLQPGESVTFDLAPAFSQKVL